MTAARTRVRTDSYLDSMRLLGATRAMRDAGAVDWAGAVMATPANIATLADEGFTAADLDGVHANDLVLAVRAETAEAAERALERGEEALFPPDRAAPAGTGQAEAVARTVTEAAARAGSANVAVISVPGAYAALAAHQALTAGLHVLLFSDNVPVQEEVELKDRAARLGRLLMGPGAGTAVLGGTGLGLANAVGTGPDRADRVGIVAAAGTGAQEVMSLLDRWGVGVSHVLGVGGRDLSAEVGGRMAVPALRALDADPGTGAIVILSKPPDEIVARRAVAAATRKPVVAAFLGLDDRSARGTGPEPAIPLELAATLEFAATLEQGAVRIAAAVGITAPDLTDGLAAVAAAAAAGLAPRRRAVHGYFSGGTLCYEAQLILTRCLGPVRSNVPLRPELRPPAEPGGHLCLDLGEEEYTRGRPHPMIDPAARAELLAAAGRDPDVAVVLLDVVLGYGAHEDPARVLAPVCAELMADGGPAVVAYVLGTARDPQGYEAQRAALQRAGCRLAPTAARAAHLAAAIAARRPELAEAVP